MPGKFWQWRNLVPWDSLLMTHNKEDHCAEGACFHEKFPLAYSGKSVTILDVIRTFEEYLVLKVAQSTQVGYK